MLCGGFVFVVMRWVGSRRCLGGVRSSCVVGVWLSSCGGFAGVMALRPLLRGGVALAVVLPACGRIRVLLSSGFAVTVYWCGRGCS